MSATYAPESLYAEDGEPVWIRADLMTRSQARYKVWEPRGVWFLHHDRYPCRLIDMRVRKEWMRETGHPDSFYWFTVCDRDEPGAVAFWCVESGDRA